MYPSYHIIRGPDLFLKLGWPSPTITTSLDPGTYVASSQITLQKTKSSHLAIGGLSKKETHFQPWVFQVRTLSFGMFWGVIGTNMWKPTRNYQGSRPSSNVIIIVTNMSVSWIVTKALPKAFFSDDRLDWWCFRFIRGPKVSGSMVVCMPGTQMTSVFEGQPFKNKAFATPAGSSTGFQVREQYLRNTLVWKTLACHFDVKSQTWQNIDLQNIPETEKKAFFCHCKHKGNSRRTPKPTFRWHWLLMVVQKSQTANRRLDASNLVHNRIDYQPQLVDAGFLNHQRYICMLC